MSNIYIIIFLFSFNIFSQELSIKLNDKFFLKNSLLKKDILLKNDTSIFLIPGFYNFYNDSTDFVIYYDGKKDYSLCCNRYNRYITIICNCKCCTWCTNRRIKRIKFLDRKNPSFNNWGFFYATASSSLI